LALSSAAAAAADDDDDITGDMDAAGHFCHTTSTTGCCCPVLLLQTCTLVAVAGNISNGSFYEVGQFVNSLVQQELTGKHAPPSAPGCPKAAVIVHL
jgi:hypothetical protein